MLETPRTPRRAYAVVLIGLALAVMVVVGVLGWIVMDAVAGANC